MKIKTKTNLLLIASALFCLSGTSCSPKNSGDGESGEGETIEELTSKQEAIEAEDEPEAESATMPTSSVSSSSVTLPEPTKGRGEWDAVNKMYNDDPRHMFWDISFYKDWTVFPQDKLPKNMLFAAENDNGVLTTITAIPVSSDITSIWQIPKETYLNQSMTVQNKAFVKSNNSTPVVDRKEFRNRIAYETNFTAEVPDHRNGQKTTHDYKVRKVALVNDGEIIELTVMAPPEALKRFGDDTFTFLIGKFNIVE